MVAKYKRVLLKLSGEALAGEEKFGFSHEMIQKVCDVITRVVSLGVEMAIVVGGGNIWRGRQGATMSMDHVTADHMGMMATAINALYLQDTLESKGLSTRVQTAVEMREFAEPYIRRRALHHLDNGRVVIFACGTGSPHFTTDTAAALRAVEINADALLLAKNIDGVYDADPNRVKDAHKFDEISCQEALERGLMVTDNTALSMCINHHMPILLFDLKDPENIVRVVCGEKIGTLVTA